MSPICQQTFLRDDLANMLRGMARAAAMPALGAPSGDRALYLAGFFDALLALAVATGADAHEIDTARRSLEMRRRAA